MRINRMLIALALATVVGSGCESDPTGPANPEGSYRLFSVAGRTIPAQFTGERCGVWIDRGRLDLERDRVVVLTLVLEDGCTDPGQPMGIVQRQYSGEFKLTGTDLRLMIIPEEPGDTEDGDSKPLTLTGEFVGDQIVIKLGQLVPEILQDKLMWFNKVTDED